MNLVYHKLSLEILGTVLMAAVIGLLAWFAVSNTASADSDYTFNASGSLSLGNMFPQDLPFVGNTGNSLTGSNPNGYTVTAVDAKVANTGYMVTGANVLHNKFKIGATALSLDTADVAQTLLNTSGPGTSAVPLYVSQNIDYNDAIANGYTITITYTVVPK
jgi:hypothetical protein